MASTGGATLEKVKRYVEVRRASTLTTHNTERRFLPVLNDGSSAPMIQ